MARARNLKPGYFQNEDLADCGVHAHLLFSGLWTIADRSGRMEDRPRRIKIQLMPFYEVEIDELLDSLAKHGFISRYERDGQKFIQIINFEKHQNPHVKEVRSTIPAPDSSGASTGKTGTSRADSLLPLTDSLNPISGAEPTGSAPVITLTLNDKSEYPITDEQLQEFKKLYPSVDVIQALRDMRGWCLANPAKRKTKTGIMRFVTTWLSKEQNRGGQQHGSRQQADNSVPARIERARQKSHGTDSAIDGTASRIDEARH